jgi:acyl-CoA oxidase
MVTVRVSMPDITGWDLLKAVTMAFHYTTFRKQFRRRDDAEDETTIFNYASVRLQLLSLPA